MSACELAVAQTSAPLGGQEGSREWYEAWLQNRWEWIVWYQQALAQRDATIAQRDAALAERDTTIHALTRRADYRSSLALPARPDLPLTPLVPIPSVPHTCASAPAAPCAACAVPWFARHGHLFGTTPEDAAGDTCGVWAGAAELLRNVLLIAQSGWGKTTIMYRALCWLLFNTGTPMVIFDGSGNGTLSKNLLLWWHTVLDHAEAQTATQGGTVPADFRSRLLYMKVEERNRCGISFDLFHPSVVQTTDGREEPLGVKEIVTCVQGTLAFMEEDNEKFKLVRRYGEAGFAVLCAGGKKAQDLDRLYDIESIAFRLELRAEIERRYGLDLSVKHVEDEDLLQPERTSEQIEERDYIRTQWHVIEDLFRQVKTSAAQLEHLVGSTRRHFAWATTTFKWFFNRPVVRLDRFFTRGGVLLVHVASGDRDANANARAAIYASCRAAMSSKDRTQPCLFVLDEQEGWRMGLLANDVAANARNSAMYHWFSLHDSEQVGRSFKTLWNLCQRKIIGALADEELARFVLQYTDALRPDGLLVDSTRETVSATHNVVAETAQARARVAVDAQRHSHEGGGLDDFVEERVNEGLYAWNPHRADPAEYDKLCREIRKLEREHESLRTQAYQTGRMDLEPALDALAAQLRDLRGAKRHRLEAAQWGEQADTKTRILRERPARETEMDVEETKDETASEFRRSERTTTQRTRVESQERIPIGEQIPYFTRALVNPPIGRGLHIAVGEETTFVDHAIEPLPLDHPGADSRLEQIIRAQRERLEASWQRRRPALRLAQGDPPAEPAAPLRETKGKHEVQRENPRRRTRRRGPAPPWADRCGGGAQ